MVKNTEYTAQHTCVPVTPPTRLYFEMTHELLGLETIDNLMKNMVKALSSTHKLIHPMEPIFTIDKAI